MSVDITDLVIDLRKLKTQLWQIQEESRHLICPRCGELGIITQKMTVSKKRFKYKKWYVLHTTYTNIDKPKKRKQKWCYLNKEQLEESTLQEKVQKIEHQKKQLLQF